MEEFRKIELNQSYSVSNLGNVRNDKTGKILKPLDSGKGYVKVRLFKGSHKDYDHIAIHRLVAFAFPEICGEYSEGLQVDHINTVRNDNRAVNLRWVTPTENRLNTITNERFRNSISGENHPMYGKKHTDEAKKKMSDAKLGKPGYLKGKHWRFENGVRVWY